MTRSTKLLATLALALLAIAGSAAPAAADRHYPAPGVSGTTP